MCRTCKFGESLLDGLDTHVATFRVLRTDGEELFNCRHLQIANTVMTSLTINFEVHSISKAAAHHICTEQNDARNQSGATPHEVHAVLFSLESHCTSAGSHHQFEVLGTRKPVIAILLIKYVQSNIKFLRLAIYTRREHDRQ